MATSFTNYDDCSDETEREQFSSVNFLLRNSSKFRTLKLRDHKQILTHNCSVFQFRSKTQITMSDRVNAMIRSILGQ